MSQIRLKVRTPVGLKVDRDVRSIRAEDRTGWFGIRPGRAALVAVLPPGLLVFRDDGGERYVALAGGLLSLDGDECRVMSSSASLFDTLEEAAEGVRIHERSRRERSQQQRGALFDLARGPTVG